MKMELKRLPLVSIPLSKKKREEKSELLTAAADLHDFGAAQDF